MMLLAGAGVAALFHARANRIAAALVRAENSFEKGNWSAAKGHYTHYLSANPEDVERLLRYAQTSMNITEDRNRALRDAGLAYYQVALIEPDNREALERLIEIQVRRNAWGDLEFFSSVFHEKAPDDAFLNYYHAFALDRMQRSDEAIEAYSELMDSGTDYIDVYGNLARILYERGREGQAEAVLDLAVAHHPGDARAYLQRVKVYLAAADVESSVRVWKQAAALAPTDPEVLIVGARLALATGDMEEAVRLGESALSSAPDNHEASLSLLAIYEKNGDLDKAIALIENMDPLYRADNPMYLLAHAQLLLFAGRVESFDESLATYRATYPDHTVMFDYLEARHILAKGNATQAATMLTTVVEMQPDFRQAQYYLAVAHLRSQQRSRASSTLELYLRRHPDDSEARLLFEQEFGARDSAQEIFRRARLLVADESSEADPLIATARTLMNWRSQTERGREARLLAKELLGKAILEAPSDSRAYFWLSEMLLASGEVAQAEKVLQSGADHGIPDHELRLGFAGVSLIRNQVPEARALFADQLSEVTMTVDDIIRWANYFAVRGSLTAAIDLLEPAIVAAAEEERFSLEFGQLELATRYGELDRAMSLLEALQDRPEVLSKVGALRTLNDHKEQIIHGLIRLGSAQDPKVALRLVSEIRASDPDNHDYRILHARVLINQSPPELELARRMVEPLLRTEDMAGRAELVFAAISVREGDLAGALEHTERATSASPEDVEAQIYLGRLQIAMDRYIEAEASLERVLATNPDEVRAIALLVRTYTETGRLGQAEVMLKRLDSLEERVSLDSNISRASLRARFMMARGEHTSTVEAMLRNNFETNPEDVGALNDLVQVLVGSGQDADARELLIDFAEHHPDRPEAWVALGRFYLSRHSAADPSAASHALTRALVIQRDYGPALRSLIVLHLKSNRRSEALVLCERYLTHHSDDSAVLYQAAVLKGQLRGDLDEALELVSSAIGLYDRGEYRHFRGLLFLARQEYESALADLQRVSRLHVANLIDFDLALAEAYLGIDEPELGREYYESAKSGSRGSQSGNPERMRRVEELILVHGGDA